MKENKRYKGIVYPETELEEKNLLRSLMNVRMPAPVKHEFLEIQDAYLQEDLTQKGITDYRELTPVKKDIYLWQGDITTLKCGVIVNAANNGMTGCYYPCHVNISFIQ